MTYQPEDLGSRAIPSGYTEVQVLSLNHITIPKKTPNSKTWASDQTATQEATQTWRKTTEPYPQVTLMS